MSSMELDLWYFWKNSHPSKYLGINVPIVAREVWEMFDEQTSSKTWLDGDSKVHRWEVCLAHDKAIFKQEQTPPSSIADNASSILIEVI